MGQQWWVYMIQTQSGKLYTGITTDIDRRFEEHQLMSPNHHADDKMIKLGSKFRVKGAKFFYSDPALAVVYREASAGRSDASKREAQIKKLSRKKKCQLAGVSEFR
ncbi:MAG: GIY-YIG nuclease family protein [Spongiibacteraceae bacterium]|nr:GIY-YIG nuclease family protein [Spongiibacteraceae bacterium]